MESTASTSDGPPSCAGGCGFFGSPDLSSYCSICFKKVHGEEEFKKRTIKRLEEPPNASEVAANPTTEAVSAGAVPSSPEVAPMPRTSDAGMSCASSEDGNLSSEEGEPGSKKPKTSRCFTCKKKVGLTGFTCRCGGTFCGIHRYSDKHECSFDYKTAGREQLAKANPTIAPEKVDKI
mmetsp:Transcript_10562/g.25016  ORF Transcript_10562/g.25016 Transcript_10562/m.25016 type:complete len:178 (+) Transcript_10562:98-631(+)|eukprot:3399000-Rhodomonas_salina.2